MRLHRNICRAHGNVARATCVAAPTRPLQDKDVSAHKFWVRLHCDSCTAHGKVTHAVCVAAPVCLVQACQQAGVHFQAVVAATRSVNS